MPLTKDEFQGLFRSFEKSAFRLQLLSEYVVPAEREDYAAYVAGEPLPERSGNPWLETMANQIARGRTWTTVHLLPDPLTVYMRYLIDWWYVYHARAGARILFLPPRYARDMHTLAEHDFWLFDDHVLVLMRYSPAGAFLEADSVSSPAAIVAAQQARDFALARAEDLRVILARRRAGQLL